MMTLRATNQQTILGVIFLITFFGPHDSANGQQPSPVTPSNIVRTDGDGRPLPKGAIARLGTLTLRGLRGPLHFTADGKHFVCFSNSGRAALFVTETGKQIFEADTGTSSSHLHASPDGRRIASANPRGFVWDTKERKELFRFEGIQADFSNDGSRLITVSKTDNGRCRVLNAATGALLAEHRLDANVEWAQVIAGGAKIVFGDKAENQTVVFDLATQERESAIPYQDGIYHTVSPDGKSLAVADGTKVRLLDLETGDLMRRWKQRADSPAVFSADGKRLAWAGYDESEGIAYAWVADAKGGPPQRVGTPTNDFSQPCFTHDGKELVVFLRGGAAEWRDLETGQNRRTQPGHSSVVNRVGELPDAKHALSQDPDNWLVWDLSTFKVKRRYPHDLPNGERQVVRIGNTETMLTADGNTGIYRLRDIVSGRELAVLEGAHGGGARRAILTPDNKSIAVDGHDYHVRVFDLMTRKLRYTLIPDVACTHLSLSDDGRYLKWGGIRLVDDDHSDPTITDTHTGKDVADAALFVTKPNGTWEYWGQDDAFARLAPLKLKGVDKSKGIFGIQFSPDRRFVAIRRGGPPGIVEPNRIGVWDLATGQALSHFDHLVNGELYFSPDSRLLLTTDRGAIDVWEIATGRKVTRYSGHSHIDAPAFAFLKNRRAFLSGGADTQVFLWDLTGRAPDGVWRPVSFSSEELQSLWGRIGGDDLEDVRRAIWELVADPRGAVSLLSRHVAPAPRPDAAAVAAWIVDLNAADFGKRERGAAGLSKLGDAVLPFLRDALKNGPSLEQSRRLERLVADLDPLKLSGDRRRLVSAVEILELIDNAPARAVLEKLAGGFAESQLTKDAQAALHRMSKKTLEQIRP